LSDNKQHYISHAVISLSLPRLHAAHICCAFLPHRITLPFSDQLYALLNEKHLRICRRRLLTYARPAMYGKLISYSATVCNSRFRLRSSTVHSSSCFIHAMVQHCTAQMPEATGSARLCLRIIDEGLLGRLEAELYPMPYNQ